jgi:hypothetical protein
MHEVAKGVQYIHSEGIVHGDLKGVSTLMSHFVKQLIPSSTRKMSYSTLISAAKLLTLGSHDIQMPPLRNPRHSQYIMPLQSYLASAPVHGQSAKGAKGILMR